MLTLDELKGLVHQDLSQGDKALLILGSFDKPSKVSQLRMRARQAGLREMEKWNVSEVLARTRGHAINTVDGWELSPAGWGHIAQFGSTQGISRDAVATFQNQPRNSEVVRSNKVFLVHGRDAGAMHEVARFLEKIGLEVTILHERPNKGRTLISKFEQEAAGINYAVVLMTPDDFGALKGSSLPADRARQNVVFELGFFIGRLGAENVCALVANGVERPSDFDAVVYVSFDGSTWRMELARELRAAGIPFDHSKVF